MNHQLSFSCLSFNELTINALYEIMQLRQEVFVVEQNCPYLDADGLDMASFHIVGQQNKKIVAYARIIPKGLAYEKYTSMGRIVTSPAVRGQGVGKQLVAEALAAYENLFANQPLKISAQSYLISFYEGFGFQIVGEEYLEDGIPHIGMVRNI